MKIFVYGLLILVIIATVFLTFSTKAAESNEQSSSSNKSTKRLKLTEEYLKAIDKYSTLQSEKSVRAVTLAKTRLTRAVEDGKKCLVEPDQVKREACKDILASDYSFAKQIYRLIKFYALEEGVKVICVRADLGVGEDLEAKGFNSTIAAREATVAGSKETGRTKELQVFLCADSKGQRKLRVQDGSGTWLPLAPEEKVKPEFQINSLPGDARISELEGKVGLN